MRKSTRISLINRVHTLLIVAVIALFASCSKATLQEENPNEPPKPSSPYAVSYDEAVAELDSMLADIDTPTKGKSPRKVANYYTTPISGAQTKSNADAPFIYIFNFENNESFAILSGDKRTTPVFAITEAGNYNEGDSIDNPGFNLYMSLIPGIFEGVWEEIDKNPDWGNGETVYSPWTETYRKGHIIQAKWGQNHPYNITCPRLPSWDHPAVAGCVATAVAQVMYYHQYPPSYNGVVYNWNEMVKHTGIAQQYGVTNYEPAHYMIARLISSLGAIGTLSMSYGYEESGAQMENVARTFRNFGYSLPTPLQGGISTLPYRYDLLKEEIVAGRPMVMGVRSSSSGHAWVADAVYERARKLTYYAYGIKTGEEIQENYYVHCNWGWDGACDGYYYATAFDARYGGGDITPVSVTTKSSKDYYYRYDLQIIRGISKP